MLFVVVGMGPCTTTCTTHVLLLAVDVVLRNKKSCCRRSLQSIFPFFSCCVSIAVCVGASTLFLVQSLYIYSIIVLLTAAVCCTSSSGDDTRYVRYFFMFAVRQCATCQSQKLTKNQKMKSYRVLMPTFDAKECHLSSCNVFYNMLQIVKMVSQL